MFIQQAFHNPAYFGAVILIVIVSVTLHEFCHALAATWQGDDTAKHQGYLTLNPLVHITLPSLVMLALAGICWGECPFNPRKLRHPYSEAWVAAAGPLANLALLGLFCLLFWLAGSLPSFMEVTGNRSFFSKGLAEFAWMGAQINAFIFLFNLLPLPPLDGSRMIQSLVPASGKLYAGIGQSAFPILVLLFYLPLGLSEWFHACSENLATGTLSILLSFLPTL